MIQEQAKLRLIDAMHKSQARIDKMLDDNSPDKDLQLELDLFGTMEKEARKYHIPYTAQRQK